MDFIRNFPFICIVLCLATGVISSVLKPKAAKVVSVSLVSFCCVCSFCVLFYTISTGTSFTYMMGHFPAPWGNEIRAGVLEGVMASFFTVIMLLSLLGGEKYLKIDIEEPKQNLYFALINLLLSSLLALVYTNDLFTAYVFVEINTIAAGGLIMIRSNGHSMLAATKYMIMSLLGSGLLLIGITLQYDLTGHLLMSNIKESIGALAANGEYAVPLTVIIGLMSVGIAIKSALFPFHAWLPDAYGFSTASSAAILSSLVSKAYLFLLIKIMYRVIGTDVFWNSKITNVFFILGVAGMLFGSFSAIKEHDMRRMIAFSSVAQIGYIYMGFGFGTELGMVAAVFHILSHAATKSMLFVACRGLSEVSGDKKDFSDLKGSGFRNKMAGVAFSVGAFSMVGVPLFAGFISKLYLTSAALDTLSVKMVVAVIVLAVSTILNALYFIRAVISIYTPRNEHYRDPEFRPGKIFCIGMVCFIAINFVLGLASHPIINAIEQGLHMFS
ncbi:MAG: sodium:proton antiporter [Lachnospiraceae bacterium]|nr:sodium:proton antiporter [Lachnospiraceae bacterium]